MCKEQFLVHRVAAFAFLGPPPSEDAWQVHHKDGNPGNNHITNLEYVTGSQNLFYSFASGTRGRGGPSKPVMYRALGTKDWTRCPSMTSAALELGIPRGALAIACCRQTPLKGNYEVCVDDMPQPELKGEEWRQMLCPMLGEKIPGRTVSSLGRLRTQTGRIHSGCLRSGYLAARYTLFSASRLETVHRLVAFAFLGPPPSSQHSHVNHKDGDKQNNCAANLEYVTPAENRAHYLENRTAPPLGKCRSDSKPVWSRACKSNEEWTWHPSMLSAARVLGLRSGLVSHCIHRNQRHTGGYEFRAADVFQPLPGEEWRDVDLLALVEDKRKRARAQSKFDRA